MSKKIMIIGASILQLPAIEKAREMGLEVIAVDMNPEAIGFKVPGIKKEVISTIDAPAIVEAARKHQIDSIMTLATDVPMCSVAAVAREMGLIGIDEDTAVKATNKVDMRKILQEKNVPIPKFFKVGDRAELKKAVEQLNASFVIKPADSSGSRGIYLIENVSDKKQIVEAYEYSRQFSKSGDMVVEEYMRGPEVSVETLTVDGVCHVIQITDKLTTGAPHFVEMGHSQPTRLNKEIVGRIAEVAKAANKAIGIMNGPSHTEIIVTEEGPKIVELGARLGGDNITTYLVPLSTGINMVECCIKIALGEKPDIEPRWNKGSAIRYFKQSAGNVKKIDGIDKAKNVTGVIQVNIVHGEGETITDVIDSGSRMGFVIAQGDCAAEAIRASEYACACMEVEIQ